MNPTTIERVERQSVQTLPDTRKGDSASASEFWFDTAYTRSELLPAPYTIACERALRWYDQQNAATLWHGAKSGQIKKVGATGYTLSGGRNLTGYFDEVFRYCQFGAGFRAMIELIFNDYLVYNRGGFMEIIAPGNPMRPPTGRVTGLAHLDAYYCTPTGDPVYPVLYTDRKGKQHLLHHTRVVQFVDTPQGDQNHPGFGRSALWRSIFVLWQEVLMGRYTVANLDDKPPPGMVLVGGMTREKWNAAWSQFRTDQTMDERPDWGRVIPIFGADASLTPTVNVVSFSTPPEKFDYKVYTELDVHKLALAMGVDIQELWELTGSNLGSGQQSEVQHSKSQGKLYGEFLSTFERGMNNYVLPAALEFEFEVRDPYEAQQEAANAKAWVDVGMSMQALIGRENTAQFIANNVPKAADVLLDDDGQLIQLPDNDRRAPEQQAQDVTVDDAAPNAEETGGQPITTQDDAPAANAQRKDFEETRARFEADLSDLLTSGADRRRAGVVMRALLNRLGKDARLDGLKEGGVQALSDADLNAHSVWLAQQSSRVSAFLKDAYRNGLSDAEVQQHVRMWGNVSLREAFYEGIDSADADGLYQFTGMDGEEECATCRSLKGRTMRMSEWTAQRLRPGVDVNSFECRSYNCRHRLTRVTDAKAFGWKYDPLQPRDGHGMWTDEGGQLRDIVEGITGENTPKRFRSSNPPDNADLFQSFDRDAAAADEWRAIAKDYTLDGYHNITTSQRMGYDDWFEVTGGSRADYDLARRQALTLESGLRRLNVYDGEIYRGIQADSLSSFRGGTLAQGEIVQLPSLSSFTSKMSVATQSFGRGGIVFHVTQNNSGVSIQSLMNNVREAEVLVPSQSAYRITSVIERAKLPESDPFYDRFGWLVRMEEIT